MRPDILHFLYLLKSISFTFNCSVIALGEVLCYWIKSEQLHSDFTWPYLYGPAKKITVLPLDFLNSPQHICLYFLFYITKLCTHFKESEVAQSCPTLWDPMDCSLPGSCVHGIFQAIVLEWVAISFSRGDPPDPGIEPGSPALQTDALPSEPSGEAYLI